MGSALNIDSQRAMMKLFESSPAGQRIRRMWKGLKAPHYTGEYKYARLQTLRLLSPLLALLIPLLMVMLLAIVADWGPDLSDDIIGVRYLPREPIMDIPEEPPEMDLLATLDIFDSTVAAPSSHAEAAPSPENSIPKPEPVSQPFQIVKSRIVLSELRTPPRKAGREAAIASGGGDRQTEEAVLKALRWLKKEQRADGSWGTPPIAMTGLALLTYLAHGETPTSSKEFGETVERGIKYLLDKQGKDGGYPRRYQHAIAAYALCEAFGMTKVPMVRDAATKAVDILIKGQNQSGGFDYGLIPSQRDDTSVMGWCAQALKAAQIAGLDNEGLDRAVRKSVEGFKKNASPTGGFGYTGPGAGGLTGVGVLCMQLLGASEDVECRRGLVFLDRANMDWENPGPLSSIYYWYYISQAKFHGGDQTWPSWNRQMKPVLTGSQVVLKDAIKDADGNSVDIGYWEHPGGKKGHSTGTVMNTALCALQLEIYYKFLPTYASLEQQSETIASVTPEIEIDLPL